MSLHVLPNSTSLICNLTFVDCSLVVVSYNTACVYTCPPPDLAVFGAPLEVAVQRSTLGTDGLELPTAFRQCIDFLEEHGKCV